MVNILDIFEYNQHFVAMMNIINAVKLNKPSNGHKHHIIPKCWFKMMNLPVDNSKSNLVVLTPENHLKVHQLAILCAKDETLKCNMKRAVHMLHGGSMSGIHHTEEAKQKMSESHKGQVPWNKGISPSAETRRKISERQKGRIPPNKGKKASIETRKKLSEASKNSVLKIEHCRKNAGNRKGTHWKKIDGKRIYY